MASFNTKRSSSSVRQSTSTSAPEVVDPLDIDQYIHSESMTYSASSASVFPPKPQGQRLMEASISHLPGLPLHQQTFAGPSHQYEQYTQQSSLPVDAIANAFSMNDSASFTNWMQDPLDFAFDNSLTSSGILPGMTEDLFDFSTSAQPSNLDFSMPPAQIATSSAGFVMPEATPLNIPSVLYQPRPHAHQTPRAWPGMHQQAAAMKAKAQSEALALKAEQQRQKGISRSRNASTAGLDLLEDDDEDDGEERFQTGSVDFGKGGFGMTASIRESIGKAAVANEDMDEDERLLNSEEGKKLSSKERRQLRNKVSARAFRSRRKGYITQLESELAAKVAESHDFEIKNRRLTEENKRLTKLTQMLLSSSHFSGFLDELSASGAQFPTNAASKERRDMLDPEGDHTESTNLHIGLAMLPASPLERNVASHAPVHHLMSSTYLSSNLDQQVYAVVTLPNMRLEDRESSGSNYYDHCLQFEAKDLPGFGTEIMSSIPDLSKSSTSILPSTFDLPSVKKYSRALNGWAVDEVDKRFAHVCARMTALGNRVDAAIRYEAIK